VAAPVLRHRIIPNFNADAEGVTVEQIIEKILTLVPRGAGGSGADKRLL
jgi:MoxR-like ATPase